MPAAVRARYQAMAAQDAERANALPENFARRFKAFTGFAAQIIQHEIDHCNGIII